MKFINTVIGERPSGAPGVEELDARLRALMPKMGRFEKNPHVRATLSLINGHVSIAYEYYWSGGRPKTLAPIHVREHMAKAEALCTELERLVMEAISPSPLPNPLEAAIVRAQQYLCERAWCQGAHAKNRDGTQHVPAENEDASQWSIVGFLQLAAGTDAVLLKQMTATVARAAGCEPSHLQEWNDARGRTKGEILSLLEQAQVTARLPAV